MTEIRKQHTLLFVDDEANILAALKRVFRKNDYVVHTASGGEEGLEIIKRQPVDLVMSDQRMPGMTGVEFLKRVKDLYPDAVRIVLSGYSEISAITSAINEGEVYRFVTKPWNDEELKLAVAHSLEQQDLRRQNRLLLKTVQEQNEKLKTLNEELERRVEERTRELVMSQKILENLPLPVVGVDEERCVVYINKAARELLPGNPVAALGTPVQKVFTRELCDLAGKAQADGRIHRLGDYIWNERKLRLTCKVVDPQDALRGVTVLIEE